MDIRSGKSKKHGVIDIQLIITLYRGQ